ncbi:uncharacterized protein LOC130621762 [Hydractinia symbiolongicarpus]|uniref:uncharacterized protein LOC130621762 n=1 Tax=Hydractinia symbiolongicarpus TaxID=13093 RepID=UPI00254A725D|nr:uncharacterized protein LOC130621762 [Hydractinia symbiolongicarpus]
MVCQIKQIFLASIILLTLQCGESRPKKPSTLNLCASHSDRRWYVWDCPKQSARQKTLVEKLRGRLTKRSINLKRQKTKTELWRAWYCRNMRSFNFDQSEKHLINLLRLCGN